MSSRGASRPCPCTPSSSPATARRPDSSHENRALGPEATVTRPDRGGFSSRAGSRPRGTLTERTHPSWSEDREDIAWSRLIGLAAGDRAMKCPLTPILVGALIGGCATPPGSDVQPAQQLLSAAPSCV